MFQTIYKKNRQVQGSERGAAMMVALIFFIVASVLVVLGMTGPIGREFRTANDGIISRQSYFLAESAAEDAYYRAKNSMTLPGSTTLTLSGTATATAVVAPYGVGQTEIVSTGNVQGSHRVVDIQHNDGSIDFDRTYWAETH